MSRSKYRAVKEQPKYMFQPADRLLPIADGGGECPAAGLASVRRMVSFWCRVAVSSSGGGVPLSHENLGAL